MSAVVATPHDTDGSLLAQVLTCYKPNCRYLKVMTVEEQDGILLARGEFEIEESCYIDDTGHLNAVEVNICYNQMLYATIATAVHDGTAPVFDSWTMADFERKQLSGILIARFAAEFRRPIDPRSFRGEFTVDRISVRRLRPGTDPIVSMDTSFRFEDSNAGMCTGNARVAIVGDDLDK